MSRIILAMLAMTGRVTMLGISRWAEKGGSYRTVQRFFHTVRPWATVLWLFFQRHLLQRGETYLLAGDECVVTKAGKQTHGLDRFFAGLYGKSMPSLAFFALSLVGVDVLDLKAHFRGRKYVTETLKWLPQKPKPILIARIINKVSLLGRVHDPLPSYFPS